LGNRSLRQTRGGLLGTSVE